MVPAPSRSKEKPETSKAPSTRSVVLGVSVSLDGFIARRDGSVDWLIMDPTIDLGAYGLQFDVIVVGRKTLDIPEGQKGGKSPWGKMDCYIFSCSKPPGKRGGAEYVNSAPSELIRELQSRPGKDIWLMGGGELAREFLKEDLIDRIDLGIMPVLLGEGVPLFPAGFPQRSFQLVSHEVHPSGVVRVSYARVPTNAEAKKG
jgi:dihydrofolate reductase